MKRFLVPVLLSAVAVFWGERALAIPHTFERHHLATGAVRQVPVWLAVPGVYTLSVSANAGDADIYVYGPDGSQIGFGNHVGNDSLTGNLAAGGYTIRIHMASCNDRSRSCTTNFTITSATGNTR